MKHPPFIQRLTKVNSRVNIGKKPGKTILFHRDAKGCPLESFLDSLSSKAAKKVTWTLKLIEDLEVVPGQYLKKLIATQEIWECRVKVGSNVFRLLGFWDNKKLILTHGIRKKTQRLDRNEIQKAEKIRMKYFRNRGACHE